MTTGRTPGRVREDRGFDFALADRLMSNAMQSCGQRCPVGALPWAREYRPDLMAAVRAAEARLDEVYGNEIEEVRVAVQSFEAAFDRVAEAFALAREEAQLSLFTPTSKRAARPVGWLLITAP